MKIIHIFDRAGAFAENKDVARDIRIKEIIPALNKDEDITLDFSRSLSLIVLSLNLAVSRFKKSSRS